MKSVCYVAIALVSLLLMAQGCPPEDARPTGDVERGAILFASADGVSTPCLACHCEDGSGGCFLNAPNIQGQTYETIEERTVDESVEHPGGKFNFTAQDIADLEAFLASVGSSN